ncbi:hypothetical protein EMIT0196MI5_80134 [Pseudomonas sp. IT-196MI5]
MLGFKTILIIHMKKATVLQRL